MKIIVTGGAGFIGSHTVIELINNGYEPVIIDDLRNAEPFILDQIENITGKVIKHYAVNCGDVISMNQIFKKEKPGGVIHFAADKAVGESVENPLKYFENNDMHDYTRILEGIACPDMKKTRETDNDTKNTKL